MYDIEYYWTIERKEDRNIVHQGRGSFDQCIDHLTLSLRHMIQDNRKSGKTLDVTVRVS